jgi:tetratricopeptide (TPR) repeat protein
MVHATAAAGLKRVFVNPGARNVPGVKKLPLAKADARDAEAVQDPSLWRVLDREQRFDGVLLIGPVSEYLPLLTHLVSSPDYRIARVDNWGVLFVNGVPTPYTPPELESLKLSSDKDRGIYLSEMALVLDAAGQTAAARDYIAAALACAPKEPSVYTRQAALELSRKHYPDALAAANRALALHPHDPAALDIEARTYSAAGLVEHAWDVAEDLKSRAPDDMNVLFLHARISNATHAYSAEEDSLEHLIRLAEKQGLPSTDYRVYLGQCYAKQGLARPALEQLEIASKAPNLTAKQRTDLDAAVQLVKGRAGDLAK